MGADFTTFHSKAESPNSILLPCGSFLFFHFIRRREHKGGVVSDNVAGNVALFMEQRLVKVDNMKGGRFIPVKTAHT